MPFLEKTTGHAMKGLQSGSQEGARKTKITGILNAWAVVTNSTYLLSV